MARCTYRPCQARRVLPMRPEEYTSEGRVPKCAKCGNRKYYICTREKYVACNCGGYPYPHKPKISKLCHQNPQHEFHSRVATGEQPADVFWDMQLSGTWRPVAELLNTDPPF